MKCRVLRTSAAFSAPKACSICSNSLSMGCAPAVSGARAAHDEVRAAQPLAVVRRRARIGLEAERAGDLRRNLAGQRVAAGGVEGQKLVDGLQFHETRLLGAEQRNLVLQEPPYLLGLRRHTRDVFQAQLLADLVERIARRSQERQR